MEKPTTKPNNPCFSSGPCSKRPGWSAEFLNDAFLGRSHRAGGGKKLLKEVIETHREVLGIPADYKIGIVPASDTGAIEMAMWSMMGARGVDALAWESFGADWQKDIKDHLKIDDVRTFSAEYGEIVDFDQVDTDRDVIFTWNGTTSGVCVPNGDWIADDRAGLTFCDATSAVFAYDLPWEKLDVTTWSWQKVIGGEAAHGMLVLSPRAVERLESYVPEGRALPKIFRMTKGGKLNEGIFVGETINTPSMLCVADVLDSLQWVQSVGGLKGTMDRCIVNLEAVQAWVAKTDWVEFLPVSEDIYSRTSVCLKITDEWFSGLDDQMAVIGDICKKLDSEGVAYDIKSYRAAPSGLRIWCGATIEASDVEALMPWIEWAYQEVKAEALAAKAA